MLLCQYRCPSMCPIPLYVPFYVPCTIIRAQTTPGTLHTTHLALVPSPSPPQKAPQTQKAQKRHFQGVRTALGRHWHAACTLPLYSGDTLQIYRCPHRVWASMKKKEEDTKEHERKNMKKKKRKRKKVGASMKKKERKDTEWKKKKGS